MALAYLLTYRLWVDLTRLGVNLSGLSGCMMNLANILGSGMLVCVGHMNTDRGTLVRILGESS